MVGEDGTGTPKGEQQQQQQQQPPTAPQQPAPGPVEQQPQQPQQPQQAQQQQQQQEQQTHPEQARPAQQAHPEQQPRAAQPAAPPAAHAHAAHAQPPHVTLDGAREQFYVANRACERFSQQLGAFVKRLQEAKADDAWLSEVQMEAQKVALFHQQAGDHWAALAADIDAYVDSVRDLAEKMAVADLKGEETEEAGLPENKARTIHPELQRFQLEKKARILGKIGGVPALGPGMASVLPSVPRGQILKATASPAAREIYYSKMEDKDAAQLAGVFQFKKKAASGDDAPKAQWQQEAKAKNVRRQSEAAADELRRQQEQDEQLVRGGAGELAGVLRVRQQALREQEEAAAAEAASSYRRVSASGNTANAPPPVRELQEANPELAAKLKQRQAAATQAERLLSDEGGPAGAGAAAAGAGSGSAAAADAPSWSNAAAPFGGELASVLRKRQESDDAKAAAAPVKATPAGVAPAIGDAASSELAARLKQRASRLAAQQQDEQQQDDQR